MFRSSSDARASAISAEVTAGSPVLSSASGPATSESPTASSSGSGVTLLVVAGVLWGTGGITGQLLASATGLSGPAVAAYRLGLGGLVLLAWCTVRRVRLPRGWVQWRHVVVLGVLAAIFQAAFFSAVRTGTVSLATLVSIGSAPLVVLAVEQLAGASVTSARIRAAALGIVGLALLVGAPESGRSSAATLLCAGLALVAGSAFAAFTLVGRAAPRDLDPQASVGTAFAVGGGLLALAVAPTSGMGLSLDLRSVGLLALLAVVPTAVAYALFFRGLQSAAASTAVVIALLEPTTATVLSVLLLHERITVLGVVGAVLLLTSVVQAARSEARLATSHGRGRDRP